MGDKILCENCGLVDINANDRNKCPNCDGIKFLKCDECGNKRWFYSDISVSAKQLIDLKGGKQDEKVFDVDRNHIDNYFDVIYCKQCDNVVMEA